MDEVFRRIQELIGLGKQLARKGVYGWALVRYAQAAAMAEGLARLQMSGGVTMTQQQIAELQAHMAEARALIDMARMKLGNGHGLSGERTEWPLSDLAETIIVEIDAIFFT